MTVVDIPDIPDPAESPDYNPIGPEEAPDTNSVTRGQWMAAVVGYAPSWFAPLFYEIIKDIPAWWVKPGDLVREYYNQLAAEPIGHAYTDLSRTEYIKSRLADAGFRGQVRAVLLGQYINQGDGRQEIMHRVMRRTLDILRAHTQLGFRQLTTEMRDLKRWTAKGLHTRDANLAGTVLVLKAHVRNVADQTIRDLKRWSLTSIAAPIMKTADNDRANMLRQVGKSEQIAHDYTDTQLALKLAPLLATVGAMKLTMNALVAESDDCVKPMCEAMGPKSDLGKMLTAANIAKWLAIFAALETVTVKEIEAAALLAGKLEGGIAEYATNKVLDELEAEH